MTTQAETTTTEVEGTVISAEEAAMAALASSPEYMELLDIHQELRNSLLSAMDRYGNYKHNTHEVQTMLERYRAAAIAHHNANHGREIPAVTKVVASE